MGSVTFYTEVNGGNYESLRMSKEQVSSHRLAIVFKLFPSSIFITPDFGSADFPDDSGMFASVERADDGDRFKVHGEPRQSPSSTLTSPQQPSPQQPSTSGSLPFGSFRRTSTSSVPQRRRASNDSFSVKIILAEMNGRKIGNHLRINHFMVTNDTCNVNELTRIAERAFNVGELILTNPNGLKLEDSQATNEAAFWRCNARKTFAVVKEEYESRGRGGGSSSRNAEEMLAEIKSIIEPNILVPNSDGLREAIKSTEIVRPLKEIFKCLICQETASSPVSISMCCKQVLGCHACTSRWERPHCPHCRSGEYSTIELTVFDDVLNILQAL